MHFYGKNRYQRNESHPEKDDKDVKEQEEVWGCTYRNNPLKKLCSQALERPKGCY